ncbi:zinc ABC transporter substrate-binding protein [Candidatus Woesearchaeota archaeon]|nr:zinc ABC transporter substrate-binding protein [Candidatus Woesearchaeota archaeon]
MTNSPKRDKTNKKLIGILGLFFLIVLLTGCNQASDESTDKLFVVATTGMIADAAKNVGGAYVTVESLMGPGVDPHLYKASEGDVTKLREADIILYNGLNLEARMGDVLVQMASQKKTVPVATSIPEQELLEPPEFKGHYDPHVWFDVQNWMKVTERIRDEFTALDPEHAEAYEKNAAAYLATLADLDAYVKEKVQEVPEDQRVLITAHDAFNYFGKAYGFEVRGLQGISTEAQAGTRDVQDLVTFIVDRKIKAIFVETSIPARTIQAVQEAVIAKGWDVQIGGRLYSDAMGDEGTFDGTYAGMVTHNIDTIVGALSEIDSRDQ